MIDLLRDIIKDFILFKYVRNYYINIFFKSLIICCLLIFFDMYKNNNSFSFVIFIKLFLIIALIWSIIYFLYTWIKK